MRELEAGVGIGLRRLDYECENRLILQGVQHFFEKAFSFYFILVSRCFHPVLLAILLAIGNGRAVFKPRVQQQLQVA